MKTSLSAQARERLLSHRGEPLFLAGWREAVFLHFAVKPEHLQPFVPFTLDVRDGMAYVSCVAFTMQRLHPRLGGDWLFKPIATHEFLNVRAYVKHRGESGIYFLAEWLPKLQAVVLGPALFGLPYRWGRQSYQHTSMTQSWWVEDRASNAALRYEATTALTATPHEAVAGSLDEFLVERYTAFTHWYGWKRLFRVWHPPWQIVPLEARLTDLSLLHRTGAWAEHATFFGAHYAAGFDDVWMSRPCLA